MFHEGEREIQRRAGVERVAAQVGANNIVPWLPPGFGEFLARQPFVVIAGTDNDGRVWASPLVGGVGFARALDNRRVSLAADPPAGDPLEHMLGGPDARIGILAIEFVTRLRIRLNGLAERTPDGIVLTVEEAFGNCPKFIQRRLPAGRLEPARASRHADGNALDADQVRIVARADTFFIASAHQERGADASHRGGRPGFVEVSPDGSEVVFPDYPGNRMFQTLGNLTVDPRAGLLFLDWETGTALQVTGRAEIVWDEDEVGTRPGAERLVRVAVDAVHEHPGAMPARWELIEPSRLNPPVRWESA
ncbi:MAG TPA: pyridoxamine 5'-phosphate oxidase family protein [Solirubrobacteraceae bacterium]|nr:pyridoxamine 5'-phosphate oxidase family protein [Solirubrobacteraceae bacterium]